MRKDSVVIWQPADLGGMVALHGRYTSQRFPRHVHEEFVIGVNEAGSHSFHCRRSVHFVPPGAVALINPGDAHTGEPATGDEWNYRGIYPSAGFLHQLWEEMTGRSCSSLTFDAPVVQDHGLALALIRASQTTESSEDPLASASAMIEVLGRLLLSHAAPRVTRLPSAHAPGAARRAREFIEEHALEAITLAHLAGIAGLTRTSLVRAFRREFGMAPYEYVVARRIAHARQLLESGARPVLVALSCGFNDQSHLNRHFRRLVGVAPGAYARAVTSKTRRERQRLSRDAPPVLARRKH